ncbi:ParA family protein [Endozoicomonas lisbonensis]|uniref:ParA family protein n=1 Tax=Endozoicomonas lisbonensis TaxID=3120522 RepID=UPI003397CC2E
MGYKIGFVSQKGGPGKSTLARATATCYVAADWDVKIADLDINQSTSYTWLQRRLKSGIEPFVEVQCYGTVNQAIKQADNYDLFIFDGAPHATEGTEAIAKACDLIVIPTQEPLDDLEPSVRLAHSLVKKGVDKKKISFALSKLSNSKAQIEYARTYLGQTPYHLLDAAVQQKPGFIQAHDEGRSITECRYKGPRQQADNMIQCIMDRLEELVN